MKLLLNILFITAIIFQSIFAQDISNPEITSAEIKEHITFLASDELKGRLTGSDECLLAAEYIEKEFQSAELIPFFNNDYLQAFPVISDI